MTARVRVEAYRLPMRRYRSARADLARRDGFLLRAEADGARGLGEAAPLAGWTETLNACRAALEAAAAEGAPPWPLPESTERHLAGRPAARFGLTLAALDLEARRRGVSLSALLASSPAPERVRTHRLVPLDAPERAAERALHHVAGGAEALKLKLPADPDDAVALVAAVCDAVPDAALRLDASGAWSPAGAERALRALARWEPEVVEQPLPPGAPRRIGALQEATGVPLALDEDMARAEDPYALLEARATAWVVLKPMALGGVDRAVALGRRAMELGVRPLVTTTLDGAVARCGTVHALAALGARAPAGGLATAGLLLDDLAPDPCPVTGGAVRVPSGPGLGIEGPVEVPREAGR